MLALNALCLLAMCGSPSAEGLLALPFGRSGQVRYVKCNLWEDETVVRVEIGERLIFIINASLEQPALEVYDSRTDQMVSATADLRDDAAMANFVRLETSLFPLLPTCFGPDPDYFAFQNRLNALAASGASRLDFKQGNWGGRVSYDDPSHSGRVTWTYESGYMNQHRMHSWSFKPDSPEGLRSLHLGAGTVDNRRQHIEYGYGGIETQARENLAELPNATGRSSVIVTAHGVTVEDGFLPSSRRALEWLNARSAYRLQP
jgi:hypothetical protein